VLMTEIIPFSGCWNTVELEAIIVLKSPHRNVLPPSQHNGLHTVAINISVKNSWLVTKI